MFFSFSKGRYFCLTMYYAEPTIHWPLDEKGDSLEKALMLGKSEGKGKRRWEIFTHGREMLSLSSRKDKG